jgi:parallel beta-helix repeat protein
MVTGNMNKLSAGSWYKVLAFFAFIILSFALYMPVSAASTNYYVDCKRGKDSNPGTSESKAWRTLAKANSAALNPGDSLLLKRGCNWNETLYPSWTGTSQSPVTVTAYGDGELPIIERNTHNTKAVIISGSNLIVENLWAKGTAPYIETDCRNNPKGYVVGFSFEPGAAYNTLRNSKATGNYAGVYLRSSGNPSHHNKILNNEFTANNMMWPLDTSPGNDAGSFGVLIHGDDNEIAYNQINESAACTYDYAPNDGAAIEIYGGQSNSIHHNKAVQNNGFSEMGNPRSADNVFAYNQVSSDVEDSYFLITRGANSSYGPIYGTKAYNNSTYLTGSSSQGVVCHAGCSYDILTLKNNILWADWKSLYADAPFDEGYNDYWKTGGKPLIQNAGSSSVSSTSMKVDPQYVQPGSDYHLLSASLMIDAGTDEVLTAGFSNDLDGRSVPSGLAVDIGAYEF